jgi:hypothetical protein
MMNKIFKLTSISMSIFAASAFACIGGSLISAKWNGKEVISIQKLKGLVTPKNDAAIVSISKIKGDNKGLVCGPCSINKTSGAYQIPEKFFGKGDLAITISLGKEEQVLTLKDINIDPNQPIAKSLGGGCSQVFEFKESDSSGAEEGHK